MVLSEDNDTLVYTWERKEREQYERRKEQAGFQEQDNERKRPRK
jgi:hypothetical protein